MRVLTMLDLVWHAHPLLLLGIGSALSCLALWIAVVRAEEDPADVRRREIDRQYRLWCERRDTAEAARRARRNLRREAWPPMDDDERWVG